MALPHEVEYINKSSSIFLILCVYYTLLTLTKIFVFSLHAHQKVDDEVQTHDLLI